MFLNDDEAHIKIYSHVFFSDLCIYDTVELLEKDIFICLKKVSNYTNIMIQTLKLILERAIINTL